MRGVRLLTVMLSAFTASFCEAADRDVDAAIKSLARFIDAEMRAKGIPGLSIALVNENRIVWSQGFGSEDSEQKIPVTAETRYSFGSISKPLTGLLALQLARDKIVDLDAPVSKYLPEFKPRNKFKTAITLRQLLAHTSGLVREAPEGGFFSDGSTSREQMLKSLNATEIQFEPGTQFKYSQAGIAVVGAALENAAGKSFNALAKSRIFDPLSMSGSAFEIADHPKYRIAKGNGWTRYGKTFPWPLIDYKAMRPTGGLVSSVADFGKLIPALYFDSPAKKIFDPVDLQTAYTLQFPNVVSDRKYGVGFLLTDFQGRKLVSHGGAINGYACDFAVLPNERMGVVVCCNLDSVNVCTSRIAEAALGQLLAIRESKPLPTLQSTTLLERLVAKQLEGRYRNGSEQIDVYIGADRAWMIAASGGPLQEIKRLGSQLIVDDALTYGPRIESSKDTLKIDGKAFRREAIEKPADAPAKWKGLIGEYGAESNVWFVLEKDGKLCVLVEWFFLYPLIQEDVDRFRFPNTGLYAGEPVVFDRAGTAKAKSMLIGGQKFPRRKLDGEDGETFKIKLNRPIQDIRKEALLAKPPVEKGEFRKPDLVDLAKIDPSFKFDIRYASDNNFMNTPLYSSARAFVQRPAAEGLKRASQKLSKNGYGILFFDCYRPWHITKMFWEATPESQRIFVADPSKGSRHNRGCATDITLYDLKTGMPIEMVSGFDEFSDRAYPEYLGGTSLQRWHRQLLRDSMESEGFTVYEAEWWHFDFGEWRKYPILNDRFEDLK